jgi:hypothetical protein
LFWTTSAALYKIISDRLSSQFVYKISAFHEHATTKKSNIQKTNVTQQIFTLKIKEKLGNISPTKKFCKQTETTIYQKLFCRALHWWSTSDWLLIISSLLHNIILFSKWLPLFVKKGLIVGQQSFCFGPPVQRSTK